MSKSANRKSRSNEGVILYQNNVGKTVQTSWRPPLPLPKEVVPPTTSSAEHNIKSSEMNRRSSAANTQQASNKKDSYQSAPQISAGGGSKKWSFGRLFRKKKDVETESSSDDDRKAGFVASPKYRKKDKKKRSSKHISGGFDHIVVNPARDNEFFLPFEPIPAGGESHSTTQLAAPVNYDPQCRTTNSLDRRGKRDQNKPAGAPPSSEEEMISLNSSTTFAKYRSDESLVSGANAMNGQSRRSRAARNERYYKRLSRDGEVSHGQAPQVMYAAQPAQRWKTQPVPLSVYNSTGQPNQIMAPVEVNRPQYPPPVMPMPSMRNSTSLSHMASHHPMSYGMQRQTPNLQNTVNDNKRSISFDSQIHLQNVKKALPPPPPPRDPLRRVNVLNDHRPISYAFDHNSNHLPQNTGMKGRCVSDDRIWAGTAPMYQSASSINHPQPPQSVASSQNRRFITRAERDAHPAKKSLPSGLEFRYVAEGAPRSRKPISLLDENENKPAPEKLPSPVLIRTTKSGLPDPQLSNPQLSSEYWRRGREPHQQRPESIFNKPRSLSSSRAGELRSVPMYSEVSKPKQKPVPLDDQHGVVSAKLLIKPSKDSRNNYVEIRNNANKSSSMPNHYQRRDLAVHRGPKADSPTPNKYDEYVAEKRFQNIFDHNIKLAPDPPQRKVTKPLTIPPEPDVIMRKKPTNLEDAINELEAIYKSLKLGDETLLDRAERRDIPTPTNFEKYAEEHSEEFLDDDDDEPAGEPDLVRDDFAYRNIKHSNLAPKIVAGEKQPPFGIPVGPIAISPRSDYLHVTPDKDCQKVRTGPFKYPDIVCDDLAVRTLRKDPPGQVKTHFAYPTGSKKRATRTQSANIYTLIQRNAAKPSGGDIDDFLELAKSLERAGSMSDIHKDDDDVPSTLQLLRSLREQELGSPKAIPFRHPSQGGAICSLPEVLSKDTKHPAPLPQRSLTPDQEQSIMEEALNKIAKEARESSEKLTRDLMELRQGALITSSRPKVNKPSIERDLEQIEAVSEAAKRCRHMLLDTIPPKDAPEETKSKQSPPRRLVSEDKLIKAIDQVSTAANKVCEKILNEIVAVEPPVIVQNAVQVKNPPEKKLVMPSLIQKLDPSSARIGEIAERCMRQISQLNDSPDYDNLHQVQAATAFNDTQNDNADLLLVPGSGYVTAAENEEEIDKIMKECEKQARYEHTVSKPAVKVNDPVKQSDGEKKTTTATTTSASSSSSDCLKSSSPSTGPHLSSSITSFNPYSSSDYIKSPSSEFHAPSTDPIKTFSTTSYDVQSSSVTPNITNSPFSYSTPSPPLNVTVCSSGAEKGERSDSASQYNSSEELAMIFGIEKSSPATTTTGKKAEVVDCTKPSPVGVVHLRRSEPNKPDVLSISADTTDLATATNPELCESVLVCKLDTIDEDHEEVSPCQVSRFYLPSYASNISIIVTSDVGDDDGSGESPRVQTSGQQFDSLSSIDESSNPDSGNVSLSDFPVQSPINASLEVELAHNSRFEVAKTFVNEITISEEPSEMDYLREMYAQDELSTSFSNEDPAESDRDDEENLNLSKEQNSPGQLLHEVLSQVSRINADTNRKQLISQLENISECTKIVEDLSDRLSHPSSNLRSSEEMVPKVKQRVRFSDECDSDHEEDQSACLRSLQLIGHNLSSSEESIPPLGEIFNVPFTDSENEESESGRSSGVDDHDDQFFPFNEMEKSFVEECKCLKDALSRVVQSRQVFEHNVSEEYDLQTESPQNKSLDLEDSLTLSSEVVSVIENVDSNLIKSISDDRVEVEEDQMMPLAADSLSPVEVIDLDEENDIDNSTCKYVHSKDLEDVSNTGKAYLSPVNISLKIVNQVSKVSFIDCSDDDLAGSLIKPANDSFELSYHNDDSVFSKASEVIVVDSDSDSSLERQDHSNSKVFETVTIQTEYFSTNLQADHQVPNYDSDRESFSESEGFQKVFDRHFNVDFSEFSQFGSTLSMSDPEANAPETSQKPSNNMLPEDPSSSSSKHHRHLSLESSNQRTEDEPSNSSSDHHPPSSSSDNLTAFDAPSTSSSATKSLSLLAQPRLDDRMTTLEHVLLVCTLGVVTGNDFITMLAIIIGVLTVIAMVLLT